MSVEVEDEDGHVEDVAADEGDDVKDAMTLELASPDALAFEGETNGEKDADVDDESLGDDDGDVENCTDCVSRAEEDEEPDAMTVELTVRLNLEVAVALGDNECVLLDLALKVPTTTENDALEDALAAVDCVTLNLGERETAADFEGDVDVVEERDALMVTEGEVLTELLPDTDTSTL